MAPARSVTKAKTTPNRQFQEEWKKTRPWLTEEKGKAKCTWCDCYIQLKLTSINDHTSNSNLSTILINDNDSFSKIQ